MLSRKDEMSERLKPNHIKIELPKEKIADFCRRHHIRKLAVFGMEQELSELLGRKVDLNTPQFLSPYFRDKVLAEAEVQYAAPRQ